MPIKIHREEAEANQFARELLMPEKMFIKSYNKGHSPEELAKIYQVPLEQVMIRIKELSQISEDL